MQLPRLNSEELLPYIEFMLGQLRKTDSFWFLGVENTFTYDAAIAMNEEVWRTMGKVTARDLKEKFRIEEKGLRGLLEVLRLFPWSTISGYDIEAKDDEIILSVPHCPSQESRLARGLGEYNCKHMHFLLFSSLAREIDTDIQVHCLFAPGDPHPEDTFCKWRFTRNGHPG